MGDQIKNCAYCGCSVVSESKIVTGQYIKFFYCTSKTCGAVVSFSGAMKPLDRFNTRISEVRAKRAFDKERENVLITHNGHGKLALVDGLDRIDKALFGK